MINAGFPAEEIAAARRAAEEQNTFEVWPENWRATTFFAALGTQWRLSAMGQVTGLDYPGIEAAFRLRGIPRHRWKKLFADLQMMEAAALDYMSEKAAESKQ